MGHCGRVLAMRAAQQLPAPCLSSHPAHRRRHHRCCVLTAAPHPPERRRCSCLGTWRSFHPRPAPGRRRGRGQGCRPLPTDLAVTPAANLPAFPDIGLDDNVMVPPLLPSQLPQAANCKAAYCCSICCCMASKSHKAPSSEHRAHLRRYTSALKRITSTISYVARQSEMCLVRCKAT
jgi:hypothetical protein